MVEPVLSILICTLPDRKAMFDFLVSSLINQYEGLDVDIAYNFNEKISTGAKRNELLNGASGKYISFIDDDDEVSPYYIQEILKGAETDCDCMGMLGYMTTNGANKIGWELSKDFQNDTVTRNGKPFYIRKTNHIAPVKRELALQTMFPDISNGEDKDYSDRLNPLLKTEYKIEMPDMYHYKYITRQKEYLR
jgi:glycosyltransferase involved in cell wall biosynthesis